VVLERDAKRFVTVPSIAHPYDVTPDPELCSGHDDSSTVRDRMMHLF
jgi:hypothetical protein